MSAGEGRRVTGAIGWSSLGTVGQFAAVSAALPITARLIEPAAFGAVAFALSVVAIVTSVTITIVTQAVIEPAEIDRDHMGATLTLSVLIGLPSAVAVFAAGPLLEAALDLDGVGTAMRYLSLYVLVRSVGRVGRAELSRELRFRTLTAAQTVSFVVGGFVVPVAMAWAGYEIEALVFGMLMQETIDAVWCWSAARWVNARRFGTVRAARALLRSHSAVSAFGLTSVLSQQIDNFAIGSILGAGPLGHYSRVYRLSTMPANLFTDAIGVVLFPSIARVRTQGERVLRALTGGFLAATAMVTPLCFVAAVYADDIVRVVLGDKFGEAAAAMQFLAPAAAARVLLKVASAAHRGVALTHRLAWLSASYTLAIGGGAAIGAQYGLAEAAIGVLAGVTGGAIASWLSLRTAVPGLLGPLAAVAAVSSAVAAGAFGIALACRATFGDGIVAPAVSLVLAYAFSFGVLAAGAASGWAPASWVFTQVRNAARRPRSTRGTPAAVQPQQ